MQLDAPNKLAGSVPCCSRDEPHQSVGLIHGELVAGGAPEPVLERVGGAGK